MEPRGMLTRELEDLQQNMLRLARLVDTAIGRAVTALVERDQEAARKVIQDDGGINDLRYAIEEQCLVILATQQPAASDLRAIVGTFSVTDNLERVADYAKGIARIVIRLGDEPLMKPLIDIPRMAEEARSMIRRSLDAYVTGDVALAQEVARHDDHIDALYQQVLRELLALMIENPKRITQGTYLLWVAHNLERIGDRATNIAERVVFMTTGRLEELNIEPELDDVH